jgi:outer membrane protein TolC
MKRKALTFLTATALSASLALADETGRTGPSLHITLQEAVHLALKHNHNVRIAQLGVDEKQHVKEAAKSSYFPSIRNDTSYMRLTDTQLIQLREGSLSAPGGTPIPAANTIINQGGQSLVTSGTQSQAKENLAKLTDGVELAVETAYNKLERTQEMLKVSEEVLALRRESSHVLQQELLRGSALKSQAAMAAAQEYDAKALLLQSQLDYSEAHDEFIHAMGRTPE